MKKRGPLAHAVRSRGFTPSMRDVDGLVALLADADEGLARDAERALVRLGAQSVPRLVALAGGATPKLRAKLCRLLGKVAPGDPAAADLLLDALHDADAKTRRNAIIALGQFRGQVRVEDALLDAWEGEPRVDHRRSLAAALGKIGSTRALDRLRVASQELARGEDSDPELVRV